MMDIAYYHVDAFTESRFKGNPAGVCPLQSWLPDEQLQLIATENNLSETAFFVPSGNDFSIRWFTPELEIDLCGHATLASAFVVMRYLEPGRNSVLFQSRSGELSVTRNDDLLEMVFPSRPGKALQTPEVLIEGLGMTPIETFKSRDYMAVFKNEEQIRAMKPDMNILTQLASDGITGIIVTAPGEAADFVSRFFAPGVGVPEDPVTGSSHCTLIPYWAEKLNKSKLNARQISRRGGELICTNMEGKVGIAGKAVVYLRGTITV